MQRLTLSRRIPEQLTGSIVALGNFDGFHLGHQAVVARAIQRGFHERRPVIVATFDPHPVRYFKPEVPPFRLTSLDQRERLFAQAGADAMLVFEFGAELASMDAEAFINDVLRTRVGAVGVITGDDFSFGKGRSGDAALLAKVGAEHGIRAQAVPQVALNGERVSSGRIREALVAGDTAMATRMLTRDFSIEGIVESGDRRGRELGYPTANLRLGRYLRPRYGIYAVRVTLPDGSEHPGVASLGIRPTFEPAQELLETYILDFQGNLYGKKIEVALRGFIRDERKFDNLEALVAEMRNDEEIARHLLALD